MAVISGWLRKVFGNASADRSPTPSNRSKEVVVPPKNTTVTDDCTCSHRRTIHYYGGHGITEHCRVYKCPCNLFEMPYVKPPKPPKGVPHGGIGNPKNT